MLKMDKLKQFHSTTIGLGVSAWIVEMIEDKVGWPSHWPDDHVQWIELIMLQIVIRCLLLFSARCICWVSCDGSVSKEMTVCWSFISKNLCLLIHCSFILVSGRENCAFTDNIMDFCCGRVISIHDSSANSTFKYLQVMHNN